jgi:hypothetical protein
MTSILLLALLQSLGTVQLDPLVRMTVLVPPPVPLAVGVGLLPVMTTEPLPGVAVVPEPTGGVTVPRVNRMNFGVPILTV